MSVNKYSPHILVLPEDRADSDIANGFLLHPQLNIQSIQVLPPAGGWKPVVEKFKESYISKMYLYPNRWIVLLIDFDRQQDRLNCVREEIPADLQDRVFILGVLSNPEELKRTLGKSLESIGEALAANCYDNTDTLWNHDLLKNNQNELNRMISSVKPFLFK